MARSDGAEDADYEASRSASRGTDPAFQLPMMLEPLDEEELTVELGLVIDTSLDSSARIDRCARRAYDAGSRLLAFEIAGRLAQAARELQRLLPADRRRSEVVDPRPHLERAATFAGNDPNPRPAPRDRPGHQHPDRGYRDRRIDRDGTDADQRVLDECERAIANVACRYRDAVDWSVPEPTHRLLMRHYGEVIARFESVRGARRAAASGRSLRDRTHHRGGRPAQPRTDNDRR